MPAKKLVSDRQWQILLAFMESNPIIAKGPVSNEYVSKQYMSRRWTELANRLNSLGSGCSKSTTKWRDYWNQVKYAARKKASVRPHQLTDNEDRVIAISGTMASKDSNQKSSQDNDKKPSSEDSTIVVGSSSPFTSSAAAVQPASPLRVSSPSSNESQPASPPSPEEDLEMLQHDSNLAYLRRRRHRRVASEWALHMAKQRMALDEERNVLKKTRIALERERIELEKRRVSLAEEQNVLAARTATALEGILRALVEKETSANIKDEHNCL